MVSFVPHEPWKLISTTAAMATRRSVVINTNFDGATDTDTFVAFVKDALARVLRPGDVVVTDNLSPYKARAMRRAIEAAGATLLYLPPYSPDFNSIETAFSKVKAVPRSMAEQTVPGLFDAIGMVLAHITSDDAPGLGSSGGRGRGTNHAATFTRRSRN